MATLLHIDSSIRGAESVSRQLTAAFAEHWRAANPEGTVTYRDLAAESVPHLDGATYSALFTPAEQRSAEQVAGIAVSQPLIDEVLAADVIVLGVPMHNFSVSDRFRTWLDRVVSPATLPNQETGVAPLAGKRFVVVQSRGGAYGQGTPREDFEFQERYLRKVFQFLGADDVEFIRAELTLAKINPAMADLIPLGEKSLADAHSAVRELATV